MNASPDPKQDQQPEQPELEALLADPNLMPSEREAITHLLVATMALEALALPQDEPGEHET